MSPDVLACPICRSPLSRRSDDLLACDADGREFTRERGVWRFLTEERRAYFARFLEEYQTVREGEGRRIEEASYFRRLPYVPKGDPAASLWRIRAKSYEALMRRVIIPMDDRAPLSVVDLGAGHGWLSHRLAQHGHQVAAIDLVDNDWDGLGAHRHYQARFTPVQAEFDRLPLASEVADVVIFNASLHYSERYELALNEALRVLRPDGRIVIMDSPIYARARSGDRMVEERQQSFRERFGFPSDALASESYLTYARLDRLARELGIVWEREEPFYGWRWVLRPLEIRLRMGREPARFILFIGRRA